jgi:hypothetical protein
MKADWCRVQARMIALQEELDWDMYHRYGLVTDNEAAELVAPPEVVPGLAFGERAFEIVMARRVAAGAIETRWFARHGSTPVMGIPEHWPDEYKAVVARRIECIQRNREIGLIERLECKRRWYSESWDQRRDAALRDWLLDRCETRDLWFGVDGTPRHRGLRRRHWMIKRIAAMPGDNWTHPEGEPSAPGRETAGRRRRVPPGQIAVLDDNRHVSRDSRHLGFIPGDQILGIVVRSINHQCSAPTHAKGSAWRSGRSQDLGSCSPAGLSWPGCRAGTSR